MESVFKASLQSCAPEVNSYRALPKPDPQATELENAKVHLGRAHFAAIADFSLEHEG